MRFTKVFILLAAFAILNVTVEARKYVEFLSEPLLRNSKNDYNDLPIVVPLGGDRFVWFSQDDQIANLRSGGEDHFLAGRLLNNNVRPGTGAQAALGNVLAAARIPGTDDVLVFSSTTFGDVVVFRLSLDGRVVEERRLANPDKAYRRDQVHFTCFQIEEDGTVYCSYRWTRLYRFKLGDAGLEFCDPATEADSFIGDVLRSDSYSLLMASSNEGFVDGMLMEHSSENPRLTRVNFSWDTQTFSVQPAVGDAGTAPTGMSLQMPSFVHDGSTGKSYAYYRGFGPSNDTWWVLYSVSNSGAMERLGEIFNDRGILMIRALPSQGELLVLESGVPSSVYRFRDGVAILETSFQYDHTQSATFFSDLRRVVSSGGNLFYSFAVWDVLKMHSPSGGDRAIALGERPSYGDIGSMIFVGLPSTIDIAGDGQGGAYVTYFGINAVYHVLPSGEQKRWLGAGHLTLSGEYGSAVDGPLEIAGVRFPSLITTLSDHSVVFVDDGMLRRVANGFVSTLCSVNQGDSVDGVLSSARWTNVSGLAGGPDGSLYVIDGSCIRKVDTSLVVTTIAGVANESGWVDGRRESARFLYPTQPVVDSQGNVFVLDDGSLRVVEVNGAVSTLRQNLYGVSSLWCDSLPKTLSMDDSGNLVVGGDTISLAKVHDTETEPVQLENFSARGRRGEGDDSLTLGFSTRGDYVSLLVRGVGPTLADFGVTGSAQHAGVRLLESDGFVAAEDDDWSSTTGLDLLPSAMQEYWARQNQHFRQLGAFALREDRREGVLNHTVAEGPGFVTLQPQENEAEGVALLEVYNQVPTAERRLTNCSIRGLAGGSAGALVGGFVLEGQGTKKVLARVSGPALRGFGLSGVLAHPRLRFYNHGRFVAEKSGWENDAAVAQATSQTGAFAYRPGSEDCALVLDLPAGNYTVEAESTDGGSGVALVEIYLVP